MLLGLTALGVAACTTPAHRVDAGSPVAPAVAAAAADPGPSPKISAPGDVRSPDAWKRDINALKAAGVRQEAEAAPSTFTLNDTEAFAERARRIAAAGGAAPTEADAERAEAFARTARERATPPPLAR